MSVDNRLEQIKFMKSCKRAIVIVGILSVISVSYVVLTNLSTISQTAHFLSRFTIKELFVLSSTFRYRQPDQLNSRMLVLRMRADPGAIREAPDPNSTIVSTVPGGTVLRLLSESRTW